VLAHPGCQDERMSKVIWLGATVGSIVGGYVPCLFGADMISMSGVAGSVVGGFLGIYVAYKASQTLGL